MQGFTFGRIAIPASQVFASSGTCVAFVNISPVLPGHVLVASQRCARRVADLRTDEAADLMLLSSRVARVVERFFGATRCVVGVSHSLTHSLSRWHSTTFVIQDGKESGQSIEHVHMHIIPRRAGDAGDEIYETVERWNHQRSDEQRERRSAQRMEAEAALLRGAVSEELHLDRAKELLRLHFDTHKVDAGHGIDHALTVLRNCTCAMYEEPGAMEWPQERRLAVMLAGTHCRGEGGGEEIVSFVQPRTALLHDADDSKFFGKSEGMPHAQRIAREACHDHALQDAIVDLVVRLIGLVSASKNKNSQVEESWMLFPRWRFGRGRRAQSTTHSLALPATVWRPLGGLVWCAVSSTTATAAHLCFSPPHRVSPMRPSWPRRPPRNDSPTTRAPVHP